jgi:pimeloyl-ACP methyl ester carboxylesterase
MLTAVIRSSLAVLICSATALSVEEASARDVPNTKEIKQLIEEHLELDARSLEGMERQDEIFARLDELPPLSDRDRKKWASEIKKRWEKGEKLVKKSGRHYFWEDARKGLYIVGGESKRPKGLFIGMHGGGVGSGDAGTSASAWSSAASAQDWVGIFPEVLEKTERGWTDSGTEEWVMELIERACRTWKIDRDRIFFGGHSMGGYGTWTLGAHHADRVAALTPSAGAPTPVRDAEGTLIDVEEGVIPNLRNVRIVIYQSDDDPNVPPDANRAAVAALESAQERWGGYDFEYWEVSGRKHDLPPGGTTDFVARVADRRRDARPEKLVWQPVLDWKRQFYWLWWDEPLRNAIVVAELDREANAVRIESEQSVKGLHVLLDEELLDFSREVRVYVNGDERYRGSPTPKLSVLLATGGAIDPARAYVARIPVGE